MLEVLSDFVNFMIILMALAGFIVGIISLSLDDGFKYFCISLLLMIPIALYIYFSVHLKTEPVCVSTSYIYALEDNKDSKGGMFYYKQEMYYYYLTDYKEGKKMDKVAVNDTYIVEDKNVKPQIDIYVSKYVNINAFERFIYGDDNGEVEYKIIVPAKTLTNEFKVDMKN